MTLVKFGKFGCMWLNLKIKIYRNIILRVVLYGCETWSLTLREERRLKVFENRVLRRIFGRKRNEVTGEWRELHNEELNDPYSLPSIVGGDKMEKNDMDAACSTYGERRGVYRGLMGKSKVRRPLRIPRHRWEDNIKMDLREVGSRGMNGLIWLMIRTGGGHF